MFRLLRTAILCVIAFVAGMFYERAQQRDLCAALGGEWIRAGICTGGEEDV